jgi:hypothetical protein
MIRDTCKDSIPEKVYDKTEWKKKSKDLTLCSKQGSETRHIYL